MPRALPVPDIRLRTSEPSKMVHLLPGSNHFNLVEAEVADFPNTITGDSGDQPFRSILKMARRPQRTSALHGSPPLPIRAPVRVPKAYPSSFGALTRISASRDPGTAAIRHLVRIAAARAADPDYD